jgi:hypothetical protein
MDVSRILKELATELVAIEETILSLEPRARGKRRSGRLFPPPGREERGEEPPSALPSRFRNPGR